MSVSVGAGCVGTTVCVDVGWAKVGEGDTGVGGLEVDGLEGVRLLASWVRQAVSTKAGMAKKVRKISRRVSRLGFLSFISFTSQFIIILRWYEIKLKIS
jgi:hypothetical protein